MRCTINDDQYTECLTHFTECCENSKCFDRVCSLVRRAGWHLSWLCIDDKGPFQITMVNPIVMDGRNRMCLSVSRCFLHCRSRFYQHTMTDKKYTPQQLRWTNISFVRYRKNYVANIQLSQCKGWYTGDIWYEIGICKIIFVILTIQIRNLIIDMHVLILNWMCLHTKY